jgi:hypothetical protein
MSRTRVPDDDDLVEPVVIARLVRRSTSTLAKWRMRGSGPPFVKLGPKGVFYSLASYRAWRATRVRMSTAEEARAS